MKQKNLMDIKNGLTRKEMKSILGGAAVGKCTCKETSFYCCGVKGRKYDNRCVEGVGCCDPVVQN